MELKIEGLSLLRLIQDLKQLINLTRSKRKYLIETGEFLKHINDSLDAIDRHVRKILSSKKKIDTELIRAKNRGFGDITLFISIYYIFIKEAIDADTLSIPFSLTTYLNHLVKKIFNDTKLVFLSSFELNYFQRSVQDIKRLTGILKKYMANYPAFPEGIGILKFPYSMSGKILINSILFHEIGHYVFERSDYSRDYILRIQDAFKDFLKNELVNDIKAELYIVPLFKCLRDILLSWINEVYSDIFAVRIAGPSYFFAAVEVLQILPDVSQKNKEFNQTHPADVSQKNKEFNQTHPAIDYRFRQMAKWLDKDGWFNVLQKRTETQYDMLNQCKNLTPDSFTVTCGIPLRAFAESKEGEIEKRIKQWLLKYLDEILTDIEKKVDESVLKIDVPFDDYHKFGNLVEKYLEHAVVPSTIYNDEGKPIYPSPITLINTGYFFYLSGMDKLLHRMSKKPGNIDIQLHFEKRLNDWIAKGIEDWQIMENIKH
ncbi:MAG: hypothetical protein JW860_12335 [Sedimentisphaerales bacterium]|nr:hypothetical protein [Sedimentisphaerales bacterium]